MGLGSVTHRRSLASGVSVAAMVCALAMAVPLHAQSSTATLDGHVDGAASGTQIVATDTVTGQRATGTTDANGDYEIIGLRPSTYRVEVTGKPAQETTLLVGQTSTVNFYDASRDIVVTGVRNSVQSVRTQTVRTSITPQEIENIPQDKRNFLSFASLAPGVAVTRGTNSQIQSGATSSAQTNVFLDGMSLKNPINHGGIFGQNFGLGNPFPQIAIQEYNVETQNFGAESGQAASALVTAVTKSGGEDFHGSAFLQWQPKSFIEQPFFDKKNNVPKPDYDRKQFGGDLGGPIIPGVLSFYLAGEGTIQKLPGITRNVATPIPQNLASDINGSVANDFKQGLYFGKLTWYASDRNTFNASAFIRRENNLSDIDANATLSHGRTILTHQDRYQLQWQYNGDGLLNVLNLAYDKGTQSTPSVGTGPEFLLSNGANFSAVAVTGAHFFTQGDQSESWTLRDDLTLRRGEHTFKFGGQVAIYDLSRSVIDHFNGSYYYLNPGAVASFDPTTATPYGARVNLTPSATVAMKDTQIGLYAQDEWRPDDHWTFNIGLRWDFESNNNNNNYVTPTAIANALRDYPGWAARGINPEDYISTGNNRKSRYDQFQPRLGFAYDVKGDRDLVVFGGAGRYYDRSLFIEGVIETLTNTNKVVDVRFCGQPGAGANCIPFTNALRAPDNLRAAAAPLFPGGGAVWVLNNESNPPYADQFNLGVRKRFGEVQTTLTLSHVRTHNIFQFVRSNFYENGWYTRVVTRDAAGNVTGCTDGGDNWIQDNSPGSLTNSDGTPVPTSVCAAQNAQLAGFAGKLNRGVSDASATSTSLFLQIDKPFTQTSSWGLKSALTIQIARANNNVQSINFDDEFFQGADQTGFGYQRVPGVDDWRLVTNGIWRAPWDIILSGTLELASGPRFGQVLAPWNSSIVPPDGACCYANFGGIYKPRNFIGYKRFDLRVAKTFQMPFGEGHELTFDFSARNLFNWLNRNYTAWGAGGGQPPPIEFDGDGQVGGDARSFQAGIKYKF